MNHSSFRSILTVFVVLFLTSTNTALSNDCEATLASKPFIKELFETFDRASNGYPPDAQLDLVDRVQRKAFDDPIEIEIMFNQKPASNGTKLEALEKGDARYELWDRLTQSDAGLASYLDFQYGKELQVALDHGLEVDVPKTSNNSISFGSFLIRGKFGDFVEMIGDLEGKVLHLNSPNVPAPPKRGFGALPPDDWK